MSQDVRRKPALSNRRRRSTPARRIYMKDKLILEIFVSVDSGSISQLEGGRRRRPDDPLRRNGAGRNFQRRRPARRHRHPAGRPERRPAHVGALYAGGHGQRRRKNAGSSSKTTAIFRRTPPCPLKPYRSSARTAGLWRLICTGTCSRVRVILSTAGLSSDFTKSSRTRRKGVRDGGRAGVAL